MKKKKYKYEYYDETDEKGRVTIGRVPADGNGNKHSVRLLEHESVVIRALIDGADTEEIRRFIRKTVIETLFARDWVPIRKDKE
jgi:hypothetical protein